MQVFEKLKSEDLEFLINCEYLNENARNFRIRLSDGRICELFRFEVSAIDLSAFVDFVMSFALKMRVIRISAGDKL